MKYIPFIALLIFFYSCNEYSPKPIGYFRIDPPDKELKLFIHPTLSYSFCVPQSCKISYDSLSKHDTTLVIEYPEYEAKVLCTFQNIKGKNFRSIAEDSRKFVYRHAVKANAINEKLFENQEEKVYGVFYELKGNVATPCQFVLTDSSRNNFRGALYFNCVPKADSLAPVITYIKANILDMMQTFKWKNVRNE